MSFFYISKLVSLFVHPLSQSFLLCLLAWVLGRFGWQRRSSAVLLLGLSWLYLCSTALFANFLMGSLERDYGSRAMSAVERADIIVLLGGATRGYTHMSTLPDLNQQADRLIHAVALYKAGKAPTILVSGGSPAGGPSEARQMRDLLEVMGVPPGDVILEERSRNTHDNAVNTAEILRAMKKRRVLLVTSAFHMRRAQALFVAQGISAVPAATDYQQVVVKSVLPKWIPLPAVGNLSRTTHAMHEIIGYWVYRWRGWL
ncbi:MAG: uncharacterized SAM-binding protein YcdF (DUF218 family) [Halioglobus sp.]|jgi:uncharacterized SAM-binding protein YcdF (DUF218 family)